MRRSAFLPVLLPVLFGLGGCLRGPDYVRPTIATPATFRFEAGDAAEVANAAWWEQFQGPVLNDLIATALADNKDIKIAVARVDQFLGQFVTTRSGLFPQVSAGFSAQRQRSSQSGPLPLPAGVDALHTYARLARLRFEGGYTSYIEVLDAERSLFNVQLSYTQTSGGVFSSVIALYKAMGGGWVVTAEEMVHKDSQQPADAGRKMNQPVAGLAR